MAVYLGLDCGGSSCRALALDESGEVLFRGQSGPANVATVPPTRLLPTIQAATDGCASPEVVCGCFAGLLTQIDNERAVKMLTEAFPNSTVIAYPDYAAALRAGQGEIDVCIVAGTGSVICSRSDGNLVKSGGRGYILGDYGSGFQFGRAALKHFLQAGPDGVTPYLSMGVQELFGTLDSASIISHLYRRGSPAATAARLLGSFAKDAASGEVYAMDVIREQENLLALQIVDHVRRYHPEKEQVRLGLVGGVWKSSRLFVEVLRTRLAEHDSERTYSTQKVQQAPVWGAAYLARELTP